MIKNGIFLLSVIVLFLIVIYHTSESSSFDNPIIGCCLFCSILSSIYWVIIQQKSIFKNQWAKPSNLLFLSNLIVSFQWITDEFIGYNPGKFFLKLPEGPYTHGAILGLIATVSLILGYSVYLSKKTNWHSEKFHIQRPTPLLILLCLEYLLFFAFIATINIADFFSGEVYKSSNDVTLFGYIESCYNCVLIAIVAQVLANNSFTIRKLISLKEFCSLFPISFWIPIVLYIILRAVSGDRGPVIVLFLCFFFSYVYITHRRFKLIKILTFVIIGGVIVSIAGIARSKSTNLSISEKIDVAFSEFSTGGSFGGKSIFTPTQELSNSYICTHEAINQIENKNRNYNYGFYQLVHCIEFIPFAPSFLRETVGLSQEKLSTTEVVTVGMLGRQHTWSLGTSMIADFYLDLGAIGVAIGFFLTGLLFCWIDKYICKICHPVNPRALGIAIYFASKSLYLPRAALLGELRPLLFICIFLWINHLLLHRKHIIRQ